MTLINIHGNVAVRAIMLATSPSPGRYGADEVHKAKDIVIYGFLELLEKHAILLLDSL